MKRLVFILVLATALTGCRQSGQSSTPNPAVNIALEAATTTVGKTELMITLTDTSGEPVDAQEVEVRGDMTHAGMMPVLADGDKAKTGVYVVPFEWTMSGDWVITVTATLTDGTRAEQRFDLSIGN